MLKKPSFTTVLVTAAVATAVVIFGGAAIIVAYEQHIQLECDAQGGTWHKDFTGYAGNRGTPTYNYYCELPK